MVSYTYQNDYDNKIPNLPKWSIKYRDFPIISTKWSIKIIKYRDFPIIYINKMDHFGGNMEGPQLIETRHPFGKPFAVPGDPRRP